MSFAAALDPIGELVSVGTLHRAAAVVMLDGVLQAERYWGDASDGLPLDADTLLPFASLTKPSLTTAVLRLASRGALELGERIESVFPNAPPAVRRVTLDALLTHTAGFPEFVPDVRTLEARQAPLAEYVDATLAGGLAFAPGTRVLYSNAGFIVLGAALETLVGMAPADLLDRETFTPLGMRRSTLRPLAFPGARTARVELHRAGAEPRSEIYNSPYFKRLARPDAGLFSTPRDVARLLECYRTDGGGVLDASWARRAVQSHTAGIPGRYGPYEWASCDFGWSWEIRATKSPHPTGPRTSPETFGHTGGSGVLAFCDPRRRLTVVIHCCRDFSDGWAAERPYLTRVASALVDVADGS